jgi:SAM-dependent methyltransferase
VADLDHYPADLSDADWESAWAPYDEPTYRAALAFIQARDVVLDIGAGDLRFARRAAAQARAVVAIEQCAELLTGERETGERKARRYPHNLTVICGDALSIRFPSDITVGVLLMRHCRHFGDYVRKLQAAGCTRLITNARWGFGVEQVTLGPHPRYTAAAPGWYACQCGAVGFKPCPPNTLTTSVLARTTEVSGCPSCNFEF